MSKLYYDHLIDLGELESYIKSVAQTLEEKQELWQIVDELVHHKIMECVLDQLDEEFHGEFLRKFHEAPHDETLIEYLTQKIKNSDIEDLIRNQATTLTSEIQSEF